MQPSRLNGGIAKYLNGVSFLWRLGAYRRHLAFIGQFEPSHLIKSTTLISVAPV
jgi:hypothetical protein